MFFVDKSLIGLHIMINFSFPYMYSDYYYTDKFDVVYGNHT